MAVAFDSKATAPTDVVFSSVVTASVTTHTVGSGANRALICGIYFTANVSAVAVTWNTSQNLSLIGHGATSDGLGVVYLFGLLAPASGANTLKATWTTSASGYISSISFTGVDQGSAATSFIHYQTAQTSSTPSAITATTTNGNATVELGGNTGAASGGLQSGGTQWFEDSSGTPNTWAQYKLSTSSSTAYSTVTSGGASNNVESCCDIVLVGGAGGDVLQSQIIM